MCGAVRIVQRKLGWREVGDDEEWDVYWTDTSVTIERIMKLSRTQVCGKVWTVGLHKGVDSRAEHQLVVAGYWAA